MINVFMSYSHEDEACRNELETHLSTLKREGVIETWHDRRILAGEEFGQVIDANVDSADIILLLVSPYFIASDYCYEREMLRAMERHDKGEARVIPVIADPCDWHSTPFGKLLAAPTDGKPISKFSNRHDGYLDVVKLIRAVVRELGPQDSDLRSLLPSGNEEPVAVVMPRSGNLRVRKEFSDQEKDQFIEEAFEWIANYFEGSLHELDQRNAPVSIRYTRIDQHHFLAVIYSSGKKVASCRIWLYLRERFGSSIRYSTNDSSGDESYNDELSIDENGYTLFFRPSGFGRMLSSGDQKLSAEGGAEYFWGSFIEPLQ